MCARTTCTSSRWRAERPPLAVVSAQVLDCLQLFFETRRTGRRLLAWMQDLGQPVPRDGRERARVEDAMQQLEARGEARGRQ